MTLRIKEQGKEFDFDQFSKELLLQLKIQKKTYLLSGDGPLFDLLHPALIKCRTIFEHTPEKMIFRSSSSGWSLVAFKNQEEAKNTVKGVKSYGGFPWQIALFLKENPPEALIHFNHLGSLYVSKADTQYTTPVSLELHHYILPIWLDYALSLELWGGAGKWTKFHGRLHTLFENYGLLIEQGFPGFYMLKKEAHWLSKHGFQGKLTPTDYNLILPWDFPLSGLLELEKVLARGP